MARHESGGGTGGGVGLGDNNVWTGTNEFQAKTTLGEDTEIQKDAYFDGEVDNGDSGAADTIDWTAGNKQKSTITAAPATLTFTAPGGPASLILRVVQGTGGNKTITWPATVKWPGGVSPTLSVTAADIDVCTFYYDGTNYYGQCATDFS